jgi:hypothetical protein
MRIRYIGSGEPDDASFCEVFGLTFEKGEWVELDDVPPKLLTNPTFEVEGEPEPDVADLRAQLDAKGVKYHPRHGAEKLKALLAEAE